MICPRAATGGEKGKRGTRSRGPIFGRASRVREPGGSVGLADTENEAGGRARGYGNSGGDGGKTHRGTEWSGRERGGYPLPPKIREDGARREKRREASPRGKRGPGGKGRRGREFRAPRGKGRRGGPSPFRVLLNPASPKPQFILKAHLKEHGGRQWPGGKGGGPGVFGGKSFGETPFWGKVNKGPGGPKPAWVREDDGGRKKGEKGGERKGLAFSLGKGEGAGPGEKAGGSPWAPLGFWVGWRGRGR